jgi:hypothetical protein
MLMWPLSAFAFQMNNINEKVRPVLALYPTSFVYNGLNTARLGCFTTEQLKLTPKQVRIDYVDQQPYRQDMTGGTRDASQTTYTGQDHEHGILRGWTSVFAFTTKSHLLVLLPAILCSVAAGFLQPSMALAFGLFFNAFSEFAGGKVDSTSFMDRSMRAFLALFMIGAATLLLNGSLFSLWIAFGEFQARRVRGMLFTSLLDRDFEWYEARTNGVGSLLSQIQG